MKEVLHNQGINGVTVDDLKLLLLLYADDAILVSDNRVDLQNSLGVIFDYCTKWKLSVNLQKLKY